NDDTGAVRVGPVLRLPTLLAVTLVMLSAFAASAHAQAPSLDLSPSPAAGARTAYTVQFTPTAVVNGTAARINVLFPDGSGFGAWVGGILRVNGQTIGTCQVPVQSRSACSLNTGQTITANTRVTLVFRGIVNRTQTGPATVTVTTTAEPTIFS